MIQHYIKYDINPIQKQLIFSDNLNIEKAIDLYKRFSTQVKCTFCIGTNLTNNVGIIPPQIVIKMVECVGKPVAKISDDKGKGMCDDEEYLDKITNILRR